jgi:hypothetical protein
MTKFQTNQTPQSLYANNLRQPYGYPLRSPTPFSRTKDDDSRRGTGLSIGDVGYVNEEGAFEVLPTIEPKVKIDRNKIHTPKTMAIPRNTPIFSGVERIGLESRYLPYISLNTANILILHYFQRRLQIHRETEGGRHTHPPIRCTTQRGPGQAGIGRHLCLCCTTRTFMAQFLFFEHPLPNYWPLQHNLMDFGSLRQL